MVDESDLLSLMDDDQVSEYIKVTGIGKEEEKEPEVINEFIKTNTVCCLVVYTEIITTESSIKIKIFPTVVVKHQ